jgi:glycosyltransferase involved in cell wall biosynthesis
VKTSNIPVSYVKEEKQGLSFARNRGIIESRGRYVAFTDNDAIVDHKWVTVLYETFQKYKCDCIGGRIYLKPVKKLPVWLKRELWGFLGFLDYGDKPFYMDKKHPPFGGNMAFSKTIFEKIGYFNPNFGRIGDDAFGGEEYEFFLRLIKIGGKALYQPDAIVHHVIEEYKLRKKYFKLLHYYEGQCRGRFYDGIFKRQISGIPLFIFPQFLRSIMRYLKNPTLRMQMNIWWYLGFMKGRTVEYKNKKVDS